GLASLIDIPTYEGARPSKVFPVLGCAKPLLFVGKGETADLLRRANAGLVIPPANPQAFADAVLQLVNDPALARSLGENGRQYVEAHLTWSILVRNWLETLEKDGLPLRAAERDASPAS